MTTTTVSLEVRTFRVDPPPHSDRGCLCNACWSDYLDSFVPEHEPPRPITQGKAGAQRCA
jgi:hypothetical protein